MEKELTFLGHVFTLREDGLYETKDDFVATDNDLLCGECPNMTLISRIENGKWKPWMLSDKEHADLLVDVTGYGKSNSVGRMELPDFGTDYT